MSKNFVLNCMNFIWVIKEASGVNELEKYSKRFSYNEMLRKLKVLTSSRFIRGLKSLLQYLIEL